MATATDGPIITALAPWFGGKRTLAPLIVEALGEHRVFWDVLCGSMAVLLAKPACLMETANDLHGDLTNLAWVIQHPVEGARFYRRLRRTPAIEDIFRAAAERLYESCSETMDPDRAFHFFVASWLGRSGLAGTNIGQKRGAGHSFAVRYTANGGQPAKRWMSAVESIPAWRRRLRGVVVIRRNVFELLDKIDDVDGTAIYADPPYLPSTRTGWKASGGTSHYLHDFSEPDHARLAEKLNRFKRARIVVSYYQSPQLEELYPGWRQIEVSVNKGITNAAKRDQKGATKAVEVLLSNDRERMLF